MDAIRAFELEQLSYQINFCQICLEPKIESGMRMFSKHQCYRCFTDKNSVKMFSEENKMNPGKVPTELESLTVIEQQLIAKLSPYINVHLFKHGGIASAGHCVSFSHEAQIFPRLPEEINMIRREGKKDTSKDFTVRRYKVQSALLWLRQNNSVFL